MVGVGLWLIVGRGQYGSSPGLMWYVPILWEDSAGSEGVLGGSEGWSGREV